MTQPTRGIVMEVVDDPAKLAESRVRRAQFDRNWDWLRRNAKQVYGQYRGMCICIAGEELFAATTPHEAIDKAIVAHPDDQGRFVRYIPKERGPRIYANRRRMV